METITLPGGQLTTAELSAIFATIPVEFDFIDDHDIVRWSSANRHRLFARTDADLGKPVLEVHPGHSQARVQAVLDQMHTGKRGKLSLLIHHQGQPVNIAFYALHDSAGKYLGCVEVTQPVADHQEKGGWWRNLKQMLLRH